MFHAFAGALSSVAHFWLCVCVCWMIYWPYSRARARAQRSLRTLMRVRTRRMAPCNRQQNELHPANSIPKVRSHAGRAPSALLTGLAAAQSERVKSCTTHFTQSVRFSVRERSRTPQPPSCRRRNSAQSPGLKVN